MNPAIDTIRVGDGRSLGRLIDRLRDAQVIGVDTEFLTERSYYPRLCLLQIASKDLLAVVDPLACHDLQPLAQIFAGDVELVVHSGAQDLAILNRHLGTVPEKVFDTQIGAAFLGYGHSIGYARLVEACCNVRLRRSQAYTDWGKRPLDRRQIDYALDDVRHLLCCRKRLRGELLRRARLTWAEDECAAVRAAALWKIDPRKQWRRLSGVRGLNGRALAVLEEVTAWREEEAAARDQPRQRLVPDRVLVEIARRQPQRLGQLGDLRGLHPNEARRSGEAIIAAVKVGLRRPPDSWPHWPARPPASEDLAVGVLATLLDAFLR
ncbi:MAG: ribonuclease D, partial [Acidobacteriota bacterium]